MSASAELELEPLPSALSFFVPGKPQTAGSKTAIPGARRDGSLYANLLDGGTKKVRDAKAAWRGDLRAAAQAEAASRGWSTPGLEVGLELTLTIVRKRVSSHLRTGAYAGELKDWAVRLRPTARPDTVKLTRAAEDALTGILWRDDSQIVDHLLYKAFGDQVGLDALSEGLLVNVRHSLGYFGPRVG